MNSPFMVYWASHTTQIISLIKSDYYICNVRNKKPAFTFSKKVYDGRFLKYIADLHNTAVEVNRSC